MDFDSLIKAIEENTHCKTDSIGDSEYPEYQLTFQLEEDRKQEINVFPYEEDGKNFVRAITYIGKKSDFTQQQLISLLELNTSLRYGSLALYQGQVVMTMSSFLDNETDQARIIMQIKYLIKMADNFEKTMIGFDRK